MIIKKIDEFLNEGVSTNPVDYKKLVEYSKAITILCNGEYGDVYYNEKQNHVFVCLGDSNPFDDEYLEWYMKDAISNSYDDSKLIKVTIENECGPPSKEEGWIKIN